MPPHMRIDQRTSCLNHGLRVAIAVMSIGIGGQIDLASPATPRPHTKEHPIAIDATALEPPTRWNVPGITPLIWSLDPDSTEAFKTTERHELQLKPGNYRFGTFTFDFPFTVTLEGKVDYATALDQCVSGRGTSELKIRCTKMQPYGGQPPDYWKNQNGGK